MGFSNTIGSNTFDVLVCLGLPWLIQTAILTSSGSEKGFIEIQSAGLEYSAVLLISALVVLYGCIALNGFVLDKKIGISCIFMYVVFIAIACMLEMNVFFPVNLPPC
jgi:Ca2+/Na+ antiporter